MRRAYTFIQNIHRDAFISLDTLNRFISLTVACSFTASISQYQRSHEKRFAEKSTAKVKRTREQKPNSDNNKKKKEWDKGAKIVLWDHGKHIENRHKFVYSFPLPAAHATLWIKQILNDLHMLVWHCAYADMCVLAYKNSPDMFFMSSMLSRMPLKNT